MAALAADFLAFDDSPRWRAPASLRVWRAAAAWPARWMSCASIVAQLSVVRCQWSALSVVSSPLSVVSGPLSVASCEVEAVDEPNRDERTHRRAENVTNEPIDGCENVTNEPTVVRCQWSRCPLPVAELRTNSRGRRDKRDERTHRGSRKRDERTHRWSVVSGPLSVASCQLHGDASTSSDERTHRAQRKRDERTHRAQRKRDERTHQWSVVSGPLSVASWQLHGSRRSTSQRVRTNPPWFAKT